jgi:succinoglycan biosynthesis transport protein ExoP
MAEPGAEPTLRGYLHVLRRGRWWVAAFSLLGLAVSLALSLTATRQYSATAQLLVLSTASVTPSTGPGQSVITNTDVQTELQLVTSAQVQRQVAEKLGNVPGVAASEVGQTNVIAVTAVSPSPAKAALIANTYAEAFVSWSTMMAVNNLSAAEGQLNAQIKAIGKEMGQLRSGDSAQATALSNQQAVLKGQLAQLQVAGATASTGLELVTPATAPTAPSSPKPTQNALLGLVAGLALGVGAAFLRDSLDDTLTTGEAVERVIGAPVLATVPMIASLRKKDAKPVVITVSEPTSQSAEAYRSLRTSLQFAQQDRPLRSILVTSSSPGEGKTATVVNLGTVFTQAGMQVVIVSCDLRRPGLSQFFTPAGHADLSAVLGGSQPLQQAVTPVPDVEGLWTVGTHEAAANPTELLSSQRMRSVVGELAQRFDIVLIDSPPVLPVADATILSRYVDAVLLVVAAGQTRRAELRRTRAKLGQASAPVMGAVLNKATAQDGYGYYGGYQPYTMEPDAAPGGARGAQGARGARYRQNGYRLPSGQRTVRALTRHQERGDTHDAGASGLRRDRAGGRAADDRPAAQADGA